MQSGTRKTKRWRLEYVMDHALRVEPLMGWTASDDTRRQVKLDFATREDAVAYAQRHGLDFVVEDAKTAAPKKIAYADNFKADRPAPWTH